MFYALISTPFQSYYIACLRHGCGAWIFYPACFSHDDARCWSLSKKNLSSSTGHVPILSLSYHPPSESWPVRSHKTKLTKSVDMHNFSGKALSYHARNPFYNTYFSTLLLLTSPNTYKKEKGLGITILTLPYKVHLLNFFFLFATFLPKKHSSSVAKENTIWFWIKKHFPK